MTRTKIFKRLAALLLAASLLGTPQAAAAAQAPETTAATHILMDAQTGQVICGENESRKLPMASTTKIMTTLLTLESGNLDAPFIVDTEAICVEGSSMGLRAGDVITKRALCVGMLLPSGNDAANAAAVAVAGNIPNFLHLMNRRAAEIGMTRTCFASPSGLDAEGHGASAYDMALLTRVALQNPDFAEICGSKSVELSFGNPPYVRTLYNTNKLLTMDTDIIGVKTGFTDAAGRCLVSACRRDGTTLICVTLNDKNDWADHLALYDYGFSIAQSYTAPLPADICLPVEGGDAAGVLVYAKEPLTLTAWNGKPAAIRADILLPPFLTAPIAKGDAIGALRYTTESGVHIADLPLYAAEDVAIPQATPPKLRWWERFFTWLYGAVWQNCMFSP